MEKQDDILNSGMLYWIKSGQRGSVPVPLEYLDDKQKEILRSGLKNNRYKSSRTFISLNAHYIWVDKDDTFGYEYLVTDIEISRQIKNQINPIKRKKPTKQKYRLTLTDMKRLKNDFKNGELNEGKVQLILSKIIWRPWEYKEWKSLKQEKIKDCCEKCGSTENLLIQHTIQPRHINTIIYSLVHNLYDEYQKYVQEYNSKHPLYKGTKDISVCPKCGSSRIRLRSRGVNKGTYVCEKTRDSVVCGYVFTEPENGYDEKIVKQAEKDRRSSLKEKFCRENGLYHVAASIAIDEIIEYLNMDHVVTFCQRCALKDDLPFILK